MTQPNKTDNVLVNREQYLALLALAVIAMDANRFDVSRIRRKSCEILAMPDFIESERDMEVVSDALIKERDNWTQENEPAEELIGGIDNLKLLAANDKVGDMEAMLESYTSEAQTAINALAYRKEGE